VISDQTVQKQSHYRRSQPWWRLFACQLTRPSAIGVHGQLQRDELRSGIVVKRYVVLATGASDLADDHARIGKMADDDWYKPNPTPRAPRQPTPGEHVWTLVKAGRRFDCELHFHGESYGWECQVLEYGEIRYGQRFPLPSGAVADAEAQRVRLLSDGWTGELYSSIL